MIKNFHPTTICNEARTIGNKKGVRWSYENSSGDRMIKKFIPVQHELKQV